MILSRIFLELQGLTLAEEMLVARAPPFSLSTQKRTKDT